MSSSFTFNEREFRRLIEQDVQSGVNEMARNWTQELDTLRARLAGHPVEQIKPELQAIFARDGGSITEPELTESAQLIADNTRVEFTPDQIRW